MCASFLPIFLFIIQKVNQVYPLIDALFSQYIRQLKLFQWVFDINVNSVYTICIKDCVQIDICINCIAYYACDLEKHEYVRTGTKLIRFLFWLVDLYNLVRKNLLFSRGISRSMLSFNEEISFS